MPRSCGTIAGPAALSGLLLLGSVLTLVCAPPAAGQTGPAAAPIAQIGPVSQETFRARVRGELAEWRGKMRAFDGRADVAGDRTVGAPQVGLRRAWNKTEAAGRGVEYASAQDWDKMKASYEAASQELAVAWQKAWP
jgi:hypothetical protein